MVMKKIIMIPVLVFVLTSCMNSGPVNETANVEPVVYEKLKLRGEAQGTYYSITYYDSLNRDFGSKVKQLLLDFDQSCSNYAPNSIISKVNRNEEVILDSLFIGNFEIAQQVSLETDGAFDITVRPLVELWGFGLQNIDEVDPADVQLALDYIGYEKVHLDGEIIKSDSRLMLDYNAIAQGYSVDVVASFLRSQGIRHFLVDIGGEVYAENTKPDGVLWKVGVEKPSDSAQYGENLSAVLKLKNQGMATSGNYRKFYIKDGIKYAHTIDPKTGYPVQHSLLSATVIASSAALADAYATAFMVMGLEKAKAFLTLHSGIDVYLIYTDDLGNYRVYISDNMQQSIQENSIEEEGLED